MELIKQQLQVFLTNGDALALAKAERSVGFDVIFQSHEKPFCNTNDERGLLLSIVKLTSRFLAINFPEINQDDISTQFAVDIVEVRPDWNILDIIYFFKFIRQRQDLPEMKIFGNKITPIKLMELTAVYEENKSIAREQWHHKKISNDIYGQRKDRMLLGVSTYILAAKEKEKDTRFADLAKTLAEKQKAKGDAIYKNSDKTKQFLRDLEVHWNNQINRVEAGELTEEEAILEHNKYRLSYENK